MMITADYHGHEISLSDAHYFTVSGPLLTQDLFFRYSEATEAIDAAIKAADKQRRTEAALSLSMLDDSGQTVTIKGIHSGTGKLLGCGEAKAIYPSLDWVRETLTARAALQQRLIRMSRALDKVGVAASRRYGRVPPEQYDGLISDLAAEVTKKTALAIEMTPKPKTDEAP